MPQENEAAEAVPETVTVETAPDQAAETTEQAPSAPEAHPETPAPEEVEASDDADLVDAMTDDELRAFITKRDGKAPHHRLGHDNLLALAKNAKAVEEEAKDPTPSLAKPELLGLAKIKHPEGATSVSFNGQTYTADEDGEITVPNDAVSVLIDHGFYLV
jgi:hypothetical protein